MKKIMIIFFCVTILINYTESAFADVYVNTYQQKDGVHVQEHYRTKPNKTNLDNYSTKGNINPHTGKKGYKPRENNDLKNITNSKKNNYENQLSHFNMFKENVQTKPL